VLAGLFAASCGGEGGTVDPAPPPPAPTGTVIGQVTVEGAPLPGVLVSLTGPAAQSTATGADGGFQFVSVPAGSHTVTLASGIPNDVTFSQTTASVTITSAGQQVRADFPGEYLRTSSIRGRVLAVTHGSQPEPVEGIALGMTGLQHAADTTDASGRYEFVFARSGVHALEVLAEHPDVRLVITDLNMPEMDGLTLLDCLMEEWPGVPSLVVSAYGDSGRMSAARERGSSGFVVKPVDFTELRSAMADSLGDAA